jgi:glycosyltransferase involved in cell wall biosynthesis
MLAGRPVIATRAGGVTEIIDDETGVLVPPNDAGAMVRAIESLANDRARAAQIAARGEMRARAEFSVTAMVRGVEAALSEWLQRDPTAAA